MLVFKLKQIIKSKLEYSYVGVNLMYLNLKCCTGGGNGYLDKQ